MALSHLGRVVQAITHLILVSEVTVLVVAVDAQTQRITVMVDQMLATALTRTAFQHLLQRLTLAVVEVVASIRAAILHHLLAVLVSALSSIGHKED
jgi:hypothetical protein